VIQAPPGEGADIKGSLLFSRGGDLWAASGAELRPITDTKSSRADSDPAWSGDGRDLYFIRTSQKTTNKTRPGGLYTLYPTDLMRAKSDGSSAKTVYRSLIKGGQGFWFSHVLQPSVSPNGANIVVASDGPDGSGPVVLHVVNAKTGRMRKIPAPSKGDLGHNDPDFSRDGTRIAYTYNDNNGTTGQPRVGIFTCKSKSNCSQGKNRLMKGGYANPSWSPDSKWLAAESTSGTGRDIVAISARRGDVLAVLTDDGNSFSPVVSPDGDQIAYLRRDGTDIDLRVMTLDIDERGNITLLSDQPVTIDGGVDGGSSPSWFVARSQRSDLDPEASDDSADASSQPQAATASPAATDGTAVGEGAPAPPG
jgi:Tol biopolymer transport system component